MALEENKYDHLEELGDSDYEIVDGEPDIKGWDVKNESGSQIGDVDELLFDPQSRKVRYLIVDLDGNKLDLDEDKKVLIPIGVAQLYKDGRAQDESTGIAENNEAEERADSAAGTGSSFEAGDDGNIYDPYEDGDVVVVRATAEQLAGLPPYIKGNVTPETESKIRNIFTGLGLAGAAAGTSAYSKEDFYTHDHFNEDKFYNQTKLPVIEENLDVSKQEVETGGARITSRIVERPVEEKINLREEHVNIERKPVDRPVDATDSNLFKEEEFELTEHAEVPVINKEARIVEEISVNKDVEEKEETIRETLRNTEVEAERIDPDKTNLP